MAVKTHSHRHSHTSGSVSPELMASGKKQLNVPEGPAGWGDAELVAIQAPTTKKHIRNPRLGHKRWKASSIPTDIKGSFAI